MQVRIRSNERNLQRYEQQHANTSDEQTRARRRLKGAEILCAPAARPKRYRPRRIELMKARTEHALVAEVPRTQLRGGLRAHHEHKHEERSETASATAFAHLRPDGVVERRGRHGGHGRLIAILFHD
jgi:hypothetical protein